MFSENKITLSNVKYMQDKISVTYYLTLDLVKKKQTSLKI